MFKPSSHLDIFGNFDVDLATDPLDQRSKVDVVCHLKITIKLKNKCICQVQH